MADKSFGIKELNLIGASGTPTITSPNNLNLNASNVAISTDVTIGRHLDVDGHAEFDAVNVSGVSTFSGITTVPGPSLFTNQLSVSGVSTFLGAINVNDSYGTSGQVLTSQGSGSTPQWASASNITQVTYQSLSGTSVVFNSLPTGIKRLVIIVWGLSFNGDSDLGIRIGDSGGLETSGYTSSTAYVQNSSYGARNATDQWRVISNASSWGYNGFFEIVKNRSDANGWAFTGSTTNDSTATMAMAAGYKTLSATLDRVELKPYDTTKSFDAGNASLLYEV